MMISCLTTYYETNRTVITMRIMKQSTKIVAMMTAVVALGMIAFFSYAPLLLDAQASVPMIPKNIIKNIPQTIAKFLIDDLYVTQFFLSYQQSKVRVWVRRYRNSVQHSSQLAFIFGVASILRLIHSMRHLEWVYLTDPVHLHGMTILPYFYPYRQILHYFGPAVSGFLSSSMRCFYMEFKGMYVLPSSMNLTGILHRWEESNCYVASFMLSKLNFQNSLQKIRVLLNNHRIKWSFSKDQLQKGNSFHRNQYVVFLHNQFITLMSHPTPYNLQQQSVEASTRRIRKKFNIYMSQTSQYNPFGANSITSTYEQKKTYKYNLMKEYIKLTTKDELYKEYEQSRFLGTMILGLVGGYFAAFAITTLITRGRNLKTDQPAKWDALLYGIGITGGFAYQYFASLKRYNMNVCEYILNKYLPQAIENGFEDYQISK